MQTLTYNLLVHLNAALFEKELYFKVECHDEIHATTYGMGACACDGKQDVARVFIKSYLEAEGCYIQFIEDSLSFVVVDRNAIHQYTNEELVAALQVVSSTISNCEKMQPKFAEGTSSHTLLKNRIKALYISKALISNEDVAEQYTKEELIEAIAPIASIISKCEKGQGKFAEGTSHYTRFKKIIDAMYISKALLTDEIDKRG